MNDIACIMPHMLESCNGCVLGGAPDLWDGAESGMRHAIFTQDRLRNRLRTVSCRGFQKMSGHLSTGFPGQKVMAATAPSSRARTVIDWSAPISLKSIKVPTSRTLNNH